MATYWSDMGHKPTCVYRLYDKDGGLLYVGITKNLAGRLSKHRMRPWGRTIATCSEEWHPDRTSAQAAERSAIHHENPIHNVTRPRMECC